MKLLTMNTDQCVLYSAAMVLDSDPETLIQEIGHDGLVVTWPEMPHPRCYNGHHPQEIMDCFFRRGYAMQIIETEAFSGPDGNHPVKVNLKPDRLPFYLRYPGILTGTNICGNGHAVAWTGLPEGKVYDPNGLIYELKEFKVFEFWCAIKIRE